MRTFTGGYFEAWLSRLAEDQPDLTPAENQRNRSDFTLVTERIAELLMERENEALVGECPDWLYKLIGIAHALRATLITFNYDTLVERTAEAHDLGVWGLPLSQASWNDVVDSLPPYPPQPARWSGPTEPTLRLLKLHGSLNTFWVPGDRSGSTINRWELFGGWEHPEPVDADRRARELPGRVPFIVPPAAAKSAFYNNPITREFWRRAALALERSQRVIFLGYSMPATDLVTSGMLADHLTSHDVTIDVVDMNPTPILERLERLGVERSRVSCHSGPNAIRDFALDLDRATSCALAEQVDTSIDEDFLIAAWSENRAAAILSVEPSLSGVRLEAGPREHLSQATRARYDPPFPLQGRDLRLAIEHSDGPIIVSFPDGEETLVAGLASTTTDIGHGTGHWTVLVPTARPPRS